MTQHDDALAAAVLPFKQAVQLVSNPVMMLFQDLLLPDLVDVITPELSLMDLDPLSALAGAADQPAEGGESGVVSNRHGALEGEPRRSAASSASVPHEAARPFSVPQQTSTGPVLPLLRRRKDEALSNDDPALGGMRPYAQQYEQRRSQRSDDYPVFRTTMTDPADGASSEPATQVQAITGMIGELADDVLRQRLLSPLVESDAAPAVYPDADMLHVHGAQSPQIISERRSLEEERDNTQQPALSRIAALVNNIISVSAFAPTLTPPASPLSDEASTSGVLPPFNKTENTLEATSLEQPFDESGTLPKTLLPEQPELPQRERLEAAVGRSLDPETLATLVNEALVEQARRYGVDFS